MASIFCDGACRGNGTRHAIAGWAWAYWPGVARGEPQRVGSGRPPGAATNQRAELTALLEALRWWSSASSGTGGGPVTIYTDSMYTINCTSKWGPSWRKAGWKRAGGEIIQNLDLIQPLVALWQPKWKLVHVRGHQTGSSPEAHGNNWVDRAAVAASIGTPVTSAPVHEVDVIELVPAEAFEDKVFIAPTDRAPARKPIGKPVGQVDIRNWFVYKDA